METYGTVGSQAISTTSALIGIDTELSFRSFKAGADFDTNFKLAILGECPEGIYGIPYQIAKLNTYGLKAVFFVDPMHGALYGPDSIKPIVDIILSGGHDVELHAHPEWLQYASLPAAHYISDELHDYSENDQYNILYQAAELMVSAGAPPPVAFRAGNYSANDATLRAVAKLGLLYDSSFNPSLVVNPSTISLPRDQIEAVAHQGVIELPISCILDRPGHLRHAQVCALSSWEMEAGIAHAAHNHHSLFNVVSHSFELLTRDRKRANRTTVKRFERLCSALHSAMPYIRTTVLKDLRLSHHMNRTGRLGPNLLRTMHRIGEQAYSSFRFERS